MKFNPLIVIVPIILIIGLIGVYVMLPYVREVNIEAPGVKIGVKTKEESVSTSPSVKKPLSSSIQTPISTPAPPKEIAKETRIEITAPINGQNVTQIYLVKGKVSSPELKFYVLVHPLSTRTWWVQSYPNVQEDGQWETGCCFGTDVLGIGDSYEIWAIATKEKLYVGQQLNVDEIPEIIVESNVVRVTRPR